MNRLTTSIMTMAMLILTLGVASSAQGELIATGILGGPNTYGFLVPWEDETFDFKFAADATPDIGDPIFPDRPWLFELTGLNASNQGQTWIADESHENFSTFETFMTNGIEDFVFALFETPTQPPFPAKGEDGLAEYNFLNGYDAPLPGPMDPVDLQGYDLTEAHLTFDVLVYGEKELIPGLIAYGYAYQIRVDFYGSPVPAPPALALLGLAGFASRRRRK